MLKSTAKLPVYDFDTVMNRFCELSGWEYCKSGVWNADLSKPVVFDFQWSACSGFFGHGQDFRFESITGKNDHNDLSADPMSILEECRGHKTEEYKSKTIHSLYFSVVLNWMQKIGELPDESFIIKS